MTFDFGALTPREPQAGPIDPIQLFRGLRVRDQGVNDLWLGQAEALQPWHQSRDLKDIAIALNTGAGKTLVGLLIAQSLVNETRGNVVYACNSIQLVEQTREKAEGYGLEVTTYFRREFSNQLHSQGRAPCITTYQALFNGRSRFARSEVDAIIFDDAHTAENVLRDQFTLNVTHAAFPGVYNSFLGEFRDFFHRAGAASTFEDILEHDSPRLLIVPPFELRRRFGSVYELLRSAGFQNHDEAGFAWEHLKDHLDLCCYIVSAGAVTITPPFVPVRALPYFSGGARRIYLSATLNAADAFARTFGRIPDRIIAPETPAGACERFILAPGLHSETENDVEATKRLIENRKTLIMTPTYSRAAKWSPVAVSPPREAVSEAVASFRDNRGTPKLLLTARYDGVDLPGDTCRMMVIDGLPSSTGTLERFMWEYLRMSKTLRTTIASRVVQSFGRISRGMSDYGVVILTDQSLTDWLLVPQNQAALPPFLQRQLQLGFQISETLSPDQIPETLDRCLRRDPAWTRAYENFMDSATALPENRDTTLEAELAKAEAKFAATLWVRNYAAAATHLTATLDRARELSANTAAWHQFWIGMATDLAGDPEAAAQHYRNAHGAQKNLFAPLQGPLAIDGNEVSLQAKQAATQFNAQGAGPIQPPARMDANLVAIREGGTPAQVEEGIRQLGVLLGLSSSRPDNEEGTGPDNLWIVGDTAFCIDAKTRKAETSVYQKEEIGQMADHVQWVRDHIEVTTIVPIFVGHLVPASTSANPPHDLLVITLGSLATLAERLVGVLRDVAATSIPLNIAPNLSEQFSSRSLEFPHFLGTLNPVRLVEIEG